MVAETLEDRFKALENEDKVELLLNEIKSRHAAQAQLSSGS
jgi:hypothetical protein